MSESLGRMMTGGGNPASRQARLENDFFPTPAEVTQALIRSGIGPVVQPVWEPFAGDGAMARVLREERVPVVRCSDIAPRAPGIATRDFFTHQRIPTINGAPVMIITNPPFSLAEQTIRHAFRIGCERMALVLKSTYWHADERAALFEQHRPSLIMPLTWRPDFLGLGRPTMEAMWCCWQADHTAEPIYRLLRRPKGARHGRR